MKKHAIVVLAPLMTLSLLFTQAIEAEAKKKPLKICHWIKTSWVCEDAKEGLKKAKAIPKLEKMFAEDYDRVWDATVAVLTEKGLAVHPHGKMKAKKKRGSIKTKIFRYFKIFSAKPPVVELDFRDSYKLKLKKIELEVPQPKAKPAAKPKADDKAADKATKPADVKTTKEEKVVADAPAPPAPTITKVKLTISRKFQVHDDMTRKWIAADPQKYKVGYTGKYLLKAIEAKLKDSSKTAERTNLSVTPPVFVK
ncbi:MAG: hypothetical protein ACE5FZ_02165 [Nitrospiria bacterium]